MRVGRGVTDLSRFFFVLGDAERDLRFSLFLSTEILRFSSFSPLLLRPFRSLDRPRSSFVGSLADSLSLLSWLLLLDRDTDFLLVLDLWSLLELDELLLDDDEELPELDSELLRDDELSEELKNQ